MPSKTDLSLEHLTDVIATLAERVDTVIPAVRHVISSTTPGHSGSGSRLGRPKAVLGISRSVRAYAKGRGGGKKRAAPRRKSYRRSYAKRYYKRRSYRRRTYRRRY